MNTAMEGLKAKLGMDVSTVCYCWIIERKDGIKLGFTDHDLPIELDGVECAPQAGLTPGVFENSEGFSGDTSQVIGALTSDAISEDDLDAHLYDNAVVRHWLVDWQEPASRYLLRQYYIGEITREDQAFKVELRSYSASLDQVRGRYFTQRCDATLGDSRCGVDLPDPAKSAVGTVSTQPAAGPQSIHAGLDTSLAPETFTYGTLLFESGNLEGQSFTIASVEVGPATGQVHISILETFPRVPDVASSLRLYVGCDKTFGTCKAKFENHLKFRGFPHMPGNERALNYLDRETTLDGGPLVP